MQIKYECFACIRPWSRPRLEIRAHCFETQNRKSLSNQRSPNTPEPFNTDVPKPVAKQAKRSLLFSHKVETTFSLATIFIADERRR